MYSFNTENDVRRRRQAGFLSRLSWLPFLQLGKRGVSLIEVVAVATIFLIIAFGAGTMMNQSVKQGQVNKQIGHLQAEHEAVKGLLASVPSSKAGSIICNQPHPYMDYQESTGRCLQGVKKGVLIPAPSSDDTDKWKAASDKVFEWMAVNPGVDGHPAVKLDANYYSTQVLPALQLAGCIDCHDGSYGDDPPVLLRDFRSLSSLETDPAVASRAMLATGMGRKLLQSTIKLGPLFLESRGISHVVSFFNAAICKPPNVVTRYITATDAALAACPGVCPNGGYPDPEQCNVSCTKFGKAASSTEPAPCTEYRREVVCFEPVQKCNVTPPCDTAGTVYAINSCLENQPSLDCGKGSTTWRCINPSKPLATQANIVTYSVLSSALPLDGKGNVRRLNSEGALQ